LNFGPTNDCEERSIRNDTLGGTKKVQGAVEQKAKWSHSISKFAGREGETLKRSGFSNQETERIEGGGFLRISGEKEKKILV